MEREGEGEREKRRKGRREAARQRERKGVDCSPGQTLCLFGDILSLSIFISN